MRALRPPYFHKGRRRRRSQGRQLSIKINFPAPPHNGHHANGQLVDIERAAGVPESKREAEWERGGVRQSGSLPQVRPLSSPNAFQRGALQNHESGGWTNDNTRRWRREQAEGLLEETMARPYRAFSEVGLQETAQCGG